MRRGVGLIILSGILYGTITPGAQLFIDRGLSSLEISFFRSFFVAILLIPVILLYRQYLPDRKSIPFFIFYGLNGALLEVMMFASLGLGVPVALVALLLYSQPVWTIFLGKVFLKEKITLIKIIAAAMGFCGITVLVKSWEVSSVKSLAGFLLAVGAGVLLSIWVILGKKSADFNQHYITTTFSWSLFGAIWLIIFYFIWTGIYSDSEVFRISSDIIQVNIVQLFLFAVIAGLLPHLLFYKGVMTVSGSVAGIILLLEPATATLLANIIFSQQIGFELFMGGFLIILSNYFVLKFS